MRSRFFWALAARHHLTKFRLARDLVLVKKRGLGFLSQLARFDDFRGEAPRVVACASPDAKARAAGPSAWSVR
jgi:hypothetical protein